MNQTPKKVLLLGADGFIGRHIAITLRRAKIPVLCCARRTGALERMGFETLKADLQNPETHAPRFWQARLDGVDAVIIAAGLLTGPARAFHAVHVDAPTALYAAMPEGARGVLISAVGIDANTLFAEYRRGGEAAAEAASIPVAILRCGLVLGDTSYGGSSLIRAFAALPWAMPVPGRGDQMFNPIHGDDLAEVIIEAIHGKFGTDPLDVGGPEQVTLSSMYQSYRRWLGLRKAPLLPIPFWFARVCGTLGDLLRLGPISRTALDQINHDVLADTSRLQAETETTIRPFSDFVHGRAAGTQDLWQARLYLVRPLVRVVLAVMWILSGLVGLLAPPEAFLPYLGGTGLSDGVLTSLARTGGVVDLAIGAALLRAWRLKLMAVAQLVMVAGYTIGLTLLAPGLWLLPFGGLLKNLPILVLLVIHRVLEEER
ncbi:MAG: SDR family oxidoreductase [Rhodobacteraceae bacterium]|nr:SDR family oxidoreductase [Paracoccaceae bacterium]